MGRPKMQGRPMGGGVMGPPKNAATRFKTQLPPRGQTTGPGGFRGFFAGRGVEFCAGGDFELFAGGGRIFDSGDVDFFAGGISNFLSKRTSVFTREKCDFLVGGGFEY